jgi:hypothetical protein
MNPNILAGVSTLAVVIILATVGMASARNCGCNGGCYPNYAYATGYGYAPGLKYGYSAYDSIPWNYRGGPHPR